MLFTALVGKRLTAIRVFDPWQQAGSTSNSLPLFGAIAMEFGDLALFFCSPLRYCHSDRGTLVASEGGGLASIGCRVVMCDFELLALYRSLFAGGWQCLPGQRCSGPMEVNQEALAQPVGRSLQALRLAANQVFEDELPALEFVFGDGARRLWLTYREDLDGALQLARPGSNYGLSRIELVTPGHAFGWLLDAAPYPIHLAGGRWQTVEQYLHSLPAQRAIRRLMAAGINDQNPSAPARAAARRVRDEAVWQKYAQHPLLARRLKAIRYPVWHQGDYFPLPHLTTSAGDF